MNNKLSIKVLFSAFLGLLFFSPVFAQTIKLTPQNVETDLNSDFSLTLNAESVTDLFGVAFDLSFDPSSVTFVSAEKGDFLSAECETSLAVKENPSGNLIVGLTMLGFDCKAVSGSGDVIIFNFKSLDKEADANFAFSNNVLAISKEGSISFDPSGDWQEAKVVIKEVIPEPEPEPTEEDANNSFGLLAGIGSFISGLSDYIMLFIILGLSIFVLVLIRKNKQNQS
ncbi:MAG: cohesin domain-containing protein [Patescibacteria group bacterium]|nr:cohesin domain-containing protein [Patescibacteria group bacterium]